MILPHSRRNGRAGGHYQLQLSLILPPKKRRMPSRILTVLKIIMVPADIDERRRQLFQPEGMVRLTEEEYDVYWPWVKWLWNQQAVKLKNKTRWYRCKFSDRRKTIRGRKKAPAS